MSDPTIDPTHGTRPEAAAVAWCWRDRTGVAAPDARAREARSLRIRGVVGGAVGLAFAALLYFVGHKVRSAEVVAGIAIVLALLALAAPLTVFKRINHALEVFAWGLASGVTWVLMTILFYLVFLPIGVVLRAGKKLGITKGADRRLPSYWIPTEGRETPLESYRRQF
jgi:formate-dependent nitrite reductase membrane component NrfD